MTFDLMTCFINTL